MSSTLLANRNKNYSRGNIEIVQKFHKKASHLANNFSYSVLASKSPLITYRLFDAYFSVVNISKQFFRLKKGVNYGY